MYYICSLKFSFYRFFKNKIMKSLLNKYDLEPYFKRKGFKASLFLLCFFGIFSTLSAQTYFKVSGGNVNINGNAHLKTENLIISNESSINVSSDNAGIVLNGNLENQTNETQVFEKGSIVFQSEKKQKISGSNHFEFNDVQLKTKELELQQDIVVRNSIVFDSGDLNLQDKNLSLALNARVVNESNQNRIYSELAGVNSTGKVIAEVNLNNGMNQNVAGLGIDINSTSYVGRQIIERHHNQIQLDAENKSIKRGFYLPSFGEVSSINFVNIHYFSSELSNQSHEKLSVYALGNNLENVQINTKINEFENKAFMILDNVDGDYQTSQLSYFTLLDKSNQIEPTIKDLKFECIDRNIEIGFLVDRQLEGTYFVLDYFNEGNLVKSEIISQQKTEIKEVLHKTRLHENTLVISEVVIQQFNNKGDKQDERVLKPCNCLDDEYFVFYAENSRSVNVRFTTTNKDFYNLEVYNMLGNLVYSERVFMDEGANLHKLDASIFSNSVYIIKMANSTKNFSSKIATTNKY